MWTYAIRVRIMNIYLNRITHLIEVNCVENFMYMEFQNETSTEK